MVRLGDICRKITDGTHHSPVNRPVGPFKYITAKNIKPWGLDLSDITYVDEPTHREIFSRCDVQPNDVLLVKDGATTGRVAVNTLQEPFSLLSSVGVLRPGPNLEPRYLAYALQSPAVQDAMFAKMSGVAITRLTLKKIKELEVPIVGLDEQRRIVAEIDKQFSRLDEAVANLQRVKANLKRYKAAVLKAAVEGRLVETEASLARREGRSFQRAEELLSEIREQQGQVKQGRSAKSPVRPFNASTLPEGWAWSSLGELLSERIVNGLSIKESSTPTEVRALRLSAMRGGSIDFSDFRHLPISPGEVKDIEIVEGDIFVSRGNGSLDLVGRACIAGTPPAPTIFPDTMMRLRFTRVAPVADWVFGIWPCRLVRKQIEDKVKTTAGIYKIAQPELASVLLPFPPLAEQRRIVAEVDRRLSILRGVESEIEANLKRAQSLRQSTLAKAFVNS